MDKYPKYLTQDLEADFSNSERCYEGVKIKRKLSTKLFFGELPSGEKYKKDCVWLLYSKSKGQVFCFYCLFLQPEVKRGVLAIGCNDWENFFTLASPHERSDDHRASVLTFLLRKGVNTVQSQYDKEVKYWLDLLSKVVSVVKFLSARGLPFRGDDQQLGFTTNGFFLGCLELISEFGPFLSQHLTIYGNKGEKRDPNFERMSPRERFRAGLFLPVIDNLVVQLNKRRDCYEVHTRFEIFRNIHEKEQEEVTKQTKYLAQSYSKDID
ncbi:zinc finger MYM-type protein 1 [Trichonephila clavipes]|nr:zinc finger MYM-type protein 1 [Trichonephila clavipes]